MALPQQLPAPLKTRLAEADRALIGLWVASGSPIAAEIVAGSGCDWVLLDAEHSPNGLESILAQLYAMSAYPVAPVVRPPFGDTVTIKQYLDLGVQNLLIPMVDSAEQAEDIVRAVRYPRAGVRGVGSALTRSSRWNRVDDYLANADDTITLVVQIESAEAVADVERILAVDGVDAIFVGPADLAASMGRLGNPDHPEVQAAVRRSITAAKAAGKPVAVNSFVDADTERYLAEGISLIAVGADVALLARSAETLAAKFLPTGNSGERASY